MMRDTYDHLRYFFELFLSYHDNIAIYVILIHNLIVLLLKYLVYLLMELDVLDCYDFVCTFLIYFLF